MAKELSLSEHTIINVVKYDLKAKSRTRPKKHFITEEFKVKQVERSKRLLSILKKCQPIILFSDENLFTVNSVSNNRTDRYISTSKPEGVPESIRLYKTFCFCNDVWSCGLQ